MQDPSDSASEIRRIDPRWAGLAAFAWVCLGISQPGVTIDEPLDVAPGRHYWESVFELRGAIFSDAGVRRTFGGNPDHPPLARWILGAFSKGLEPVRLAWTGHADPTGLNIAGARVASAAAFGLTVALIGRFVRKRYGDSAGWAAAISYACMPHVFGHAHLAALESILNLFWFLAIQAWFEWYENPCAKRALRAGAMTGLVCLTKIQGWLIFPWIAVILVRSGVTFRQRIWGAIGAGTVPFWWFLGWPWMWYETAGRLQDYFSSSVERTHLNVLYLGEVFRDDRLPWHYALLQWFAAIPPVVIVFAFAGIFIALKNRAWGPERLWAWIIAGVLVLFSLPVPRYDTDRLFLVQCSAVAVLAGIGFERIRRGGKSVRMPRWMPGFGAGIVTMILVWPCLKPSPLSYVNPLLGGLKGFDAWGMDTNYWGDAIDSNLMESFERFVRPGQKVVVVPTLAVGQAAFLTPRTLFEKGVIFEEQGKWRDADWIVTYRRPSYWPDGFGDWIGARRPILVRQRDGSWLAGIWCGPKGAYNDMD